MEILLVLNETEEIVRVTIVPKFNSPIFIEAVNKATLDVVCFHTFACDNQEIIEEIANFRKLVSLIESIETLDLLEVLGFI